MYVKQLTFASLDLVNIGNLERFSAHLSQNKFFWKGNILYAGRNHLNLLWSWWPREPQLGYQFGGSEMTLFFIWALSHSTVRYLAMPFHWLPTTCTRHPASSSGLCHSSISLLIPVDSCFFCQFYMPKIGNKSNFFLLYLWQNMDLLSLAQVVICSFVDLPINLNCSVLLWWFRADV